MDRERVYVLLRNTWDGSRNCGAKLCFTDRGPIEGVSVIRQEETYVAVADLISNAYGSAEWQRFPFTEEFDDHSPVRTIFAFEVAKSRKLKLDQFTVEYRTEDSTGPLGNASLVIPNYRPDFSEVGPAIKMLDSSHHGAWYFAKLYPTSMQAIVLIPSHLAGTNIRNWSRPCRAWTPDMASVDVAGAQSNTQALPKGAFVKLDMGDEQFWVIVEKVLGQGRYVGSVDSECNMEDGACVSIGDRLQFTHQDVLKAYNNGQEM